MATDKLAGLRGRFDEFWRGRSRRERAMLAAAAIVVALGLLYGLVYAPLDRTRAKLVQRLPQLRAEHRLMTAQVAEIERLRGQGKVQPSGGGSLLRRVEASALAGGLRDQIQGLAPLGEGSVQVITRTGPLDAWIRWLLELRGQGVRVQSCRIALSDQPGQASLEATLGGAR